MSRHFAPHGHKEAVRLGTQGGRTITKAKSEAAKKNGKLGGRPRKPCPAT